MYVFVALFLLGGTLAHRPAVVQTSSGLLNGARTKISNVGYVHQFLGVPYAQAPVGKLRFSAPLALGEDVASRSLNSSRHGPNCYQPQHVRELVSSLWDHDETDMSEDCLTVNVYVPEIEAHEQLFPVIVWLPGNGFDFGMARHLDGSYLALLGNVVVVTVNYRVSSLGFLSTLTEDAPGNVGLLDQRMALRWVKNNIANFGGNPEEVTLMGRFTGSMSVSIHITTPLKEKLFQKAIMQSGIAVGSYIFERSPVDATKKLAQAIGCQTSSIPDMVNCLREIPAEQLLNNSFRIGVSFRPVFDGELIVEEPLEVIKGGHHQPVDVMIGTNQDEGSLCLQTLQFLKSNFHARLIQNQFTQQDMADMVDFHLNDFTKREHHSLSKLVLHEYSKQDSNEAIRSEYIQFCGDMYISSHAAKMAKLLSQEKKGSVYVYEFAHRPSFSTEPEFIGAAHGDDAFFSLGLVLKNSAVSDQEVLLSRRMAIAMGKFALNSNPGSVGGPDLSLNWPEYNSQSQQVMCFKASNSTVQHSQLDRASVFWHDIVPLMDSSCAPSGHEPTLSEHAIASTSSKFFVYEGSKYPLVSSSRIPVRFQKDTSQQYRTSPMVVAMAVINVVLLLVSAVCITKLWTSQYNYQTLVNV